MVLVDTSVWLRFLAGRQPFVGEVDVLLEREDVLGHAMVYGELLTGDRRSRSRLLAALDLIPTAPSVPHTEVVSFVRTRRLQGRGIGWIDAHLLASTLVAGARLWTADARLAAIASETNVAFIPK
jgi:hypothetical protein